MIRVRLAFPAVVLLFSLSIPSAGQSFAETPSAPVAPRMQQAQPQSPPESSVIVVKPGLTDEQLADLYIDRKSTRLNSSHGYISYAVFCLKKKKYLPSLA